MQAQLTPPVEHKSPGLAAALSVLLPGVGQIYVGKVGAGIGFIIAAIIGYSLFVVPGLIVLVIAAIHAYQSAQEANQEGFAAEQEELRRREEVAQSTLNVDAFVQRLEKFGKLHAHDVLSNEEYAQKKSQLIAELSRKQLNMAPEDFLYSIMDLRDQQILNDEDVAKIKAVVL